MAKLNWNPWMGVEDFHEELNRFFEESSLPGTARHPERSPAWTPAADILETPAAYVYRIELPGIPLDGMALEVRGTLLRIYGRRPFPREREDAVYLALERSYGPFFRELSMPCDADQAGIEAELRDGVLTITAPRTNDRKRVVAVD